MGWKGALRSVNAELNRQARAADKRNKQRQKELEREDARKAVNEQVNYLNQIVSLHKECRASLNWKNIESSPEPKKPEDSQSLTKKARDRFECFNPSFFDNLLGIQNWRRNKLKENIKKAIESDKANYMNALEEYRNAKNEWDKNQLRVKCLKTDGTAIIDALQEFLDIKDLPIGESVQFDISDDMEVDVNLRVLSYEKVIPEQIYTLRQTGTLSVKKMPKGQGFEIYQDHVCSALLRIARETLGVIPAEKVRANALLSAINTETGHLEDQVLVSVIVTRETLNRINLRNIDPSDSLGNFVHNMKFMKTKGFEFVRKASIS